MNIQIKIIIERYSNMKYDMYMKKAAAFTEPSF
jgi:hypothetical protein